MIELLRRRLFYQLNQLEANKHNDQEKGNEKGLNQGAFFATYLLPLYKSL